MSESGFVRVKGWGKGKSRVSREVDRGVGKDGSKGDGVWVEDGKGMRRGVRESKKKTKSGERDSGFQENWYLVPQLKSRPKIFTQCPFYPISLFFHFSPSPPLSFPLSPPSKPAHSEGKRPCRNPGCCKCGADYNVGKWGMGMGETGGGKLGGGFCGSILKDSFSLPLPFPPRPFPHHLPLPSPLPP